MIYDVGLRGGLLVFVHRVDENGAARLVPQNALEHAFIEVSNP